MSRRSSLGGRLSLSSPNLSSPIAESTHIVDFQQKFPWGGIHSPLKVENSQNYSKNTSVPLKKSGYNSGLQKLDPRIYTDVQSQGLTSRIVKYYENSRKLHKSLSINNLYKPGQFPVVHLKKNEIPYKHSRNKNSISVVRIAPPDKSVFQANSRSSILRTGSIVPTVSLGLKQANNDIARENRPILHPVADSETAPTRSVLEALKEISRKRINSDELDSNDSIKKYCKESSYDLPSNLTGSLSHQNSNLAVQTKNCIKRNRELTSPSVSPTAKIPNNGQSSNSNLIRHRKTNNEFTSSLSSSLSLLSPKRKLYEQLSSNVISKSGETPHHFGQPKQKQTCKQNVESEKNCETIDHFKGSVLSSNTSRLMERFPEKIAEPCRTRSEPVIKADSTFTESSNCKPKLTLFNKKYEISDNYNAKKVINKNDDENEVPKISFVKPKNLTSIGINLAKNAVMEKTQKTKLALMLSGLRGDLNEDQDEVDNDLLPEKSKIEDSKNVNVQNGDVEGSEKSMTVTKDKNVKSDFSILKDVSKSGTAKKLGGFKSLDSNKTISTISFDLKNSSNNLSDSKNFEFGKKTNETSTEPSSQSSLILNLKPMSNGVSSTKSNNEEFSKIVVETKNNEKGTTPIAGTSILSVINKNDKTSQISNVNSMSQQSKPNLAETNHAAAITLKPETTKSSSLVSGAILFGSADHINSNKFSVDRTEDSNSQSKGGFAFKNDITPITSTSNMFQLPKISENPKTNTLTAPTSNMNNENLQSNHQLTTTFSFGNNLSNKSNESSNVFTTSQRNDQTTPNFSFTSTTKQATPAFDIGNANPQSNLFQFGNVNTSQKVLPLKSVDSSNDKTNTVFGSNTFNSASSNIKNLFGNLSSSSINVFDNNVVKQQDNQIPVQENKMPIFGTTNDTSLQKSVTTFNFNNNNNNSNNNNNNNVTNPSNANSSAPSGVFSFGSSSNVLSVNSNPAPNFTFGENKNTSTFGKVKEEEKSHTFTTNSINPQSNIFGSNSFGNNMSTFSNNDKIASNTFGNSVTNSFNNQSSNLSSFNNPAKPSDGKFSFNQFSNNSNASLNNFSNNYTCNNNNSYNNTNKNIPDNSSNNNNVIGNNNNSLQNSNKLINNTNNNNNVNNSNSSGNSAFSFSGLSNTGGNVFSFGGGNVMTGTDSSKSAFNFSGNTNNGSNIFGANNSTNSFNTAPIPERHIRKATRRLNK
ncbi:putative uncharacterized protein DDB_G0282133 [Condylostylus longicornis]|uniref:putative uncharacterized protein DDB_G0282133 n=1 Tax=Condylostylus longicornis TaxID=2530218 RepID=UPI00244E01C4|nr:putative uncharacterized protein DDB_G0282133 [Condylostylus longicornis]